MIDDLPPADDDRESVVAGSLRTLMAAHVDDSLATGAAWTGIVEAAHGRQAMRRHRRTLAVAVLSVAALLAVFVIVRLEASPDEGAQVSTEPDATSDPTAGTAPDSWVRLLAHLPSGTSSASFVQIIDLARARSHLGIEPLADGPSEEAWTAHSRALFGDDDVLFPAVGIAPSPAELRAELGIGHEQFDQVAVVYPDRGDGTAPVLSWYVATGRFDRDAIAAAVASDPQWSPQLEERQHRGVSYYRWGDDWKLSRKSPARDLGIGGRLVVGDGWISWTASDAQAEATIDAWLEPGRSSAANAPMRAAAELGDRRQLTELGIGRVASLGTSPGSDPGPLPDLPAIGRPVTWSVGSGPEPSDIGRFGVGYATVDEAAENLEAYRRSWERFATDGVIGVEQDGSTLVATVRTGPADPGAGGLPGSVSDGTTERIAASFITSFNLGS